MLGLVPSLNPTAHWGIACNYTERWWWPLCSAALQPPHTLNLEKCRVSSKLCFKILIVGLRLCRLFSFFSMFDVKILLPFPLSCEETVISKPFVGRLLEVIINALDVWSFVCLTSLIWVVAWDHCFWENCLKIIICSVLFGADSGVFVL